MGVIRKTKAVEVLLNEFNTRAVAISAKTLIDQLRTTFNKTTIYRVLDKLEDDGVLHSFLGKDGLKWYAKCYGCTAKEHQDLHPHFQCLNCGKVDCLKVPVTISEIPNRKILVSQVLIQGTCEECIK
ncbi:transcriptional repressor [Cellulophaga sp. HaHa_2_95]|uniref:Fur family transcriptional regulator n=1 Tax=Cellulophaga sp. HaHa_2_95 TaxID=2745558 RepID=UPI001C4FD3F7|nr:transcriptional repressor [Cellulophaga sp. HaHa_2_95]QXP54628.1 transcriptional repressor [Cellulophaga sp. HaHa_2_95]